MRACLVCSKRFDPNNLSHSNTRESPIMLYALSWFFVVALLALWSLAAWTLHAVAVWTVSNAGALAGVASGANTISLPDWLAPWMPPEVAQAFADVCGREAAPGHREAGAVEGQTHLLCGRGVRIDDQHARFGTHSS